jgi:hypothetical protein
MHIIKYEVGQEQQQQHHYRPTVLQDTHVSPWTVSWLYGSGYDTSNSSLPSTIPSYLWPLSWPTLKIAYLRTSAPRSMHLDLRRHQPCGFTTMHLCAPSFPSLLIYILQSCNKSMCIKPRVFFSANECSLLSYRPWPPPLRESFRKQTDLSQFWTSLCSISGRVGLTCVSCLQVWCVSRYEPNVGYFAKEDGWHALECSCRPETQTFRSSGLITKGHFEIRCLSEYVSSTAYIRSVESAGDSRRFGTCGCWSQPVSTHYINPASRNLNTEKINESRWPNSGTGTGIQSPSSTQKEC